MAASARSNRKYCIASNCTQTSYRSANPTSFFTLPKEEERRREWLTTLGREDLLSKKDLKIKGYLVCSAHFDEDSIKIMRQLKSDAVPNKWLPARAAAAGTAHAATQVQPRLRLWTGALSVQPDDAESEDDPEAAQAALPRKPTRSKKRKATKQLSEGAKRKSKRELDSDEETLDTENDSEHEIGRRIKKLIDWNNGILQKLNGKTTDTKYKLFALNFYIASPQTYKALQSVLNLPSKSILDEMKIFIPPELDERILNLLSLKLESLPDVAKHCTVSIEEKLLRDPAGAGTGAGDAPHAGSHAYVALLQGIFVEWQQPVAHTFLETAALHTHLDNWINDVITKLFKIGIEVRAIISDQSSIFNSFAKTTKRVTIEKPYFYVDDRKIFYIFDAPYLLKCFRYVLRTSDFYFDGDIISFGHITTLFEDQKTRNLRLTPKLTEAHVEQRTLKRIRVQQAAQVFSRAVAAGLEAYISFGRIPKMATATAKFVRTMNDLFDILNSSKSESMTEDQILLLEYAQDMFERIQSVNRKTGKNNTKSLKCLHNHQVTIQAVQQLVAELQREGLAGVRTRRLGRGGAGGAALAAALRRQCAPRSLPTTTHFTMAFSKLFSKTLLKQSRDANREEDVQDILREAEYFMNTKYNSLNL